MQRYRRPLLRYCSRLLSPTRAEDAVQQAFLSAHRAIHAGNAELNLRPWLYRIAHNSSLNLLRQNGYDHDEVSEEIDGVETPPQAFERGERLRTVVAAVQELPERQRSAIVLQAVEGRSYDEIADELGVSDGAVRQLLNRARNTLREAAAALTPGGLLARIGASGAAEAPVAERIAQTVAGAGGSALLAKAGATLVVAGAVAGGAATGTLPGTGGGGHARVAAAASTPSRGATKGTTARVETVDRRESSRGGSSPRRHGEARHHGGSARGHRGARSDDPTRGDRHGGHAGVDDHSGSGSDDHSGSGDRHSGGDDHSGSGSSGSGGGSGSGDDHSGSDSSDSGSSSGDDHSGSGSGDGSSGTSGGSGDDGGSSGSGDLTSGTSGSGTSGSGTSGSDGSGSSGSGSDDGITSGSGRDRSGSDDPLDSHSGSSH